jgi:hypothetical protein|tara:strand:+ start:473 stop:661 length:189 start_codon:yes stop_codon:yes gene_type:complete
MRLPDEWLSPYEWEEWMECTCDEMPSWYSDVNLREDAYINYIKELSYYEIPKDRKERLKNFL